MLKNLPNKEKIPKSEKSKLDNFQTFTPKLKENKPRNTLPRKKKMEKNAKILFPLTDFAFSPIVKLTP